MKRAREDAAPPRAEFITQSVSENVREQVRRQVLALVFGGAGAPGRCA
jgi:hypothetical protein